MKSCPKYNQSQSFSLLFSYFLRLNNAFFPQQSWQPLLTCLEAIRKFSPQKHADAATWSQVRNGLTSSFQVC